MFGDGIAFSIVTSVVSFFSLYRHEEECCSVPFVRIYLWGVGIQGNPLLMANPYPFESISCLIDSFVSHALGETTLNPSMKTYFLFFSSRYEVC